MCASSVGHELVGNYNATFYSINGISLETRKRREHLSSEDLQKNKALLENFAKGNIEQNGRILKKCCMLLYASTMRPCRW